MKDYNTFFEEISTHGIPKSPFFTVIQLNNGKVYTVEANTTKELYEKVDTLEQDAIQKGLL